MENASAIVPSISSTAFGPMECTPRREESMAKSFPMNGGDGTYSYSKNSQLQKQGSDHAKGMMTDAITERLDAKLLTLNASNTISIVDFGCSIGPNTFSIVQNLIDSMKNKFSLQGLDLEKFEFRVFFNDHSSNDFNTLFASLPPERQYSAAGVPGSFYYRLFPRSSISLAHSSYSLQWLSGVPDDLLDVNSRAWNEGRIHYPGAGENVVNAYAAQFEKDMGVFISARAEEIVGGGMMVIIMPGTPDGVCHSKIPNRVVFELLGSCLMDMAVEGLIDKAEIDSFNLPIYFPTIEEMKALIVKNGCFSIEKIELTYLRSQGNGLLNVQGLIMHLRAALEGIFTKHFGNGITKKMFERAYERCEEISQFLESGYPNSSNLFVVLKRKLTI